MESDFEDRSRKPAKNKAYSKCRLALCELKFWLENGFFSVYYIKVDFLLRMIYERIY